MVCLCHPRSPPTHCPDQLLILAGTAAAVGVVAKGHFGQSQGETLFTETAGCILYDNTNVPPYFSTRDLSVGLRSSVTAGQPLSIGGSSPAVAYLGT